MDDGLNKKTFVQRFMQWQRTMRLVITEWWDEWLSSSLVSWCYDNVRKSPPMYHKRPNLPEITLSAVAETGRTELTIPVLNQRSYSGNKPVISSALANTRCVDLGIDRLLENLNATLGTSYSLGSKILRFFGMAQLDSLQSILEPFIERNDDFGTAYAYLRPYWYDDDVVSIKHKLCTREEEDVIMRRKVLVDGGITERDVPPRRVWDLYANRVVPYWVARRYPWGISHAWVHEQERVNVMTPINGYEWPVPMPNDGNLDLVRIELLNSRHRAAPDFRAEYAWLDILCLRQQGGKGEHLRPEEWKLDVPTIGSMYQQWSVVCYFNGLGRPLCLTLGDLESDRSWFRRAWTLQEITEDAIIGGETGNDPMEPEVQRRFDEQLLSLREIRRRDMTLEIVAQMQHRVSTKALDKVAGLVYLLRTHSIPVYKPEQSEVDAWEVLMDCMAPWNRAELFFYFPEPGNGKKRWRPSWQQVMANKTLIPDLHPWPGKVGQTEDTDTDWYDGYCIQSADVQGLSEISNDKLRQGQLVFKDHVGSPHTLKIVADHAYPIPDGSYTVLGCSGMLSQSLYHWAVGQLRDHGKFEKLSVFSLADDEQVKPSELGLENKIRMILC
ncbi:hypothetical protein IW262DRAFT_1372503 [Armillaria fumosa]|nr:hypothetical protein IW262DRAFT_1372503 [Armillaria fumosa]